MSDPYKVIRRVSSKGVVGTNLGTTTTLDAYHPDGELFASLELHRMGGTSSFQCNKILQAFFGHSNWYLEGAPVVAPALQTDPFDHELPEQKTATVLSARAATNSHTFAIKFVADNREHLMRLDRDITRQQVLQVVAAYMSILDLRHPWKAEFKLTPERAFATLEKWVTDPEAKAAVKALREKARESGWI